MAAQITVLRFRAKKITQGVHEHISKCGNGQFVITPFLKIHDGSRDSQTILSYETLFIHVTDPDSKS